jgi:D-alanine-D-alanine ligase
MSDEQASPPRRPRVAVVFGGRSHEHAISCVTAASVMSAIDPEAYDVVPVGITREGRWVLGPDDPHRLEISDGRLPEVDGSGAELALSSAAGSGELTVREPGAPPRTFGEVDVVMPLLHGPYGEDGTIQGMLELSGVPYVGSGVLSSAACMDKHYMKVLLAGHGLPIGSYTVIRPGDWERDAAAVGESVAGLGYPVFVKPARAGSSFGVTRVDRLVDLQTAVEHAQQFDPKVLVEAAVPGRELECGVLGGLDGADPDASVVGEVLVGEEHPFYDFDAKYLDVAHLQLAIPADVPADVAARVRELAVEAFRVMSCEGLARVDFFYTPNGSVLINELNTMPGFTPMSMYPQLWAASGVDYPALVDRLLRLALTRPTSLR